MLINIMIICFGMLYAVAAMVGLVIIAALVAIFFGFFPDRKDYEGEIK